MAPVLELKGVEAAYGKAKALHGIDLRVEPGEVVALLGANGAGKTTTFRVISGLMRPSAGEVRFDGASIAGCSADAVLRAGLAHCPEERHVWPEMTVEENLRLGAYLVSQRIEIERRMERIYLRFPRLKERRRQSAGTLSGGEQQMLAIGRALMSAPRLLLLDEPSLGLSPRMAKEVLAVIRELQGQGITVLLVEQNVHNALSVASRAYVFETGRVVAENTSQALLDSPDLLKAYLGG
ncbi:ABC transporter ATP-binding protein [Aquabacter spiritensis]|uniref:Amino acid/amide ABC transporter ATP-binding protein 2 (HAAT family) n=1 Tax=Aquabacter spiritensis TaxID=933073 RepID=A0A4R3LMW0_9HYPH|nr:ABC transporter ATP-binding protein [Aquabacter spiritensis]TCT01740.1 amino acid/amide ABC transporter ATP-binding protein 2 (HAAT family) [Aquabacter spiritensis]